jgi:hypothetical protein
VELVEVAKPLPETLTKPLNYPNTNLLGALTVEDMLDLIFEFYDIVDVANSDREKAAQLTQPSDVSDTPD